MTPAVIVLTGALIIVIVLLIIGFVREPRQTTRVFGYVLFCLAIAAIFVYLVAVVTTDSWILEGL